LGKIKNRYTVQIAEDGSARFDFTRDQLGWWEEEVRYEHRNWRKEDQQRFVESLLKGSGVKGSGERAAGRPGRQGAGHGYSYRLRGQGENWVYLPGTIGVPSSSSLYVGLAQQVFGLTNETNAHAAFRLSGKRLRGRGGL